MNVGGWHIFAGLFFLMSCMMLTVFYGYTVYMVFVAVRKVAVACRRGLYSLRNYLGEIGGVVEPVDELNLSESVDISKPFFALVYIFMGGKGTRTEIGPPLPMPFFNKRIFIKTSFFVVLFISLAYIQQRIEWMGNENTFYDAKEYYVAGQIVNGHRKIMGRLLHPENMLLRPYTAIQTIIYNQGIKYLPVEDGERYVWKNDWFLFYYTQKLLRPYGVGINKYEPTMVKLLDQCWESMEGMTSRDIKDPEIMENYLMGFPGLASYFLSYQGHYTGKFLNSGAIIRKTESLITQNYKVLQWLDQIKQQWEETALINKIKSNYPYVAAYRQGTVLNILQDLALTIVSKSEFSCDHPLIERMYEEYWDAMSDAPDKNFFLVYSRTNSRQAKLLYQTSIYCGSGSAANYLLSHICGKEMPVEKYNVVNRRDPLSCEFYKNNRVERVFKDELQPLLKERVHE